jgi:hypothetical protein
VIKVIFKFTFFRGGNLITIIVGTPVYRDGAYALDKFLKNQKQIQNKRPDCALIFSTDDLTYITELKDLLQRWRLRGTVISHKAEKPSYAKSRLWSIASARESIRQYLLSLPEANKSEANKLLFLDADMTFDPDVISIMEGEIKNNDALFSGYRFRNNYVGLTGAGCFLLTKKALKKIKFRCYEFKNGQTISEDTIAEMDLFRQGCKINKGFFLSIDHNTPSGEIKHIDPQTVGIYRRVMTSSIVRFFLIRISVAIHYNIPNKGRVYASSY